MYMYDDENYLVEALDDVQTNMGVIDVIMSSNGDTISEKFKYFEKNLYNGGSITVHALDEEDIEKIYNAAEEFEKYLTETIDILNLLKTDLRASIVKLGNA